jgi:hypothetical protein
MITASEKDIVERLQVDVIIDSFAAYLPNSKSCCYKIESSGLQSWLDKFKLMLMPVLHFDNRMALFRFHENKTNFSMIINMLLIFLFVYNLSN